MFEKAKNLDAAFRQVKQFSALTVVGTLLFAGWVTWQHYRGAAAAEDRLYILADGKVLQAYAGSRRDNYAVEAREHVRTFHHYFFTLHPDEKVITAHTSKALNLADDSGRDVYERLKESHYYSSLIAGNVSQEITVDSITVEMDRQPFYFRCWGGQVITRPSSITRRTLLTEGYLRLVARSEDNPHGFLIERWRILENRDLATEGRPK
jgi:conjugative transposon TraK protein